jgi:hypothetical protein
MDRKGQYYLVVVVLLCIAIFSFLSVTTGKARPESDSFADLWQNCHRESVFAVNQAVKNNKELFAEANKFGYDFKNYSKTIDTHFGFIYLVTDTGGSTRIMSLLESDITAMVFTNSSSANITKGQYLTEDTEYVNLTINNIQYNFDTIQRPNIQFLFFESKEGTTRVMQK